MPLPAETSPPATAPGSGSRSSAGTGPDGVLGALLGATLGACVPAGWLGHDLFVFLAAGAPGHALALVGPGAAPVLGGAAAGLALGAVLGRLGRSGRAALLLLAPLAVLQLVAGLLDGPGAPAAALFARLSGRGSPDAAHALLALAAALALALFLASLSRGLAAGRALLLGLAVGALAGVLDRWGRLGMALISWSVLTTAAVTLVATLVPRLRGRWRLALAAAACIWPLLLARSNLHRHTALGRPDLPAAAATEAVGPPVVLIVLDTVTASRLAPYGHERVTTPRLDRFARDEATRYTDARATSSWTLPVHASLFTGLVPGEHGATHVRTAAGSDRRPTLPARPLAADIPTLAEGLRARGYRTAAIAANGFALHHRFGLDRGFERYDDRKSGWVREYQALPQRFGLALRAGHHAYRDATEITDLALAWLDGERDGERAGAPSFFLFLNYMDAHWPYLPPAPFDRAFDDRRPAHPLDPPRELHPLLYDRELAYLDSELGRLLDGLRSRGLFDQALVVVTSDHGEAFGQHGFWKHDFTLYDEVLHVPLYLKPARGRRAAVDETPLTSADVHDLLARELGLAVPERPAGRADAEWYQQDLLVRGLWTDVLAEIDVERDLVAWIEDGRKVVVSSRGDVEAYDLDTDSAERMPLELSADERAAAVARAREWWSRHVPPTAILDELDADTLAEMRALGYAGDDEEDAPGGE